MKKTVCELNKVSKIYRIYKNPKDKLKEALSLTHQRYSQDFYALRDISFSLYEGETLGVIGLNGAGKSTLLKIITGVLSPSEGKVKVEGRITSLLELGAGFDPEYTGLENIFLYGSIFGYTKEEMDKKINQIIDFADIGDFISQPVKNYSSGMFARLAFSVIAFLEPQIFIIDEALSVGDIFFQQKCNLFMKEKMKGVTKLLVTHDMNSVAALCDRVIVLDHGVKVYDGDTTQGIEYYLKFSQNKVFSSTKEGISVPESNIVSDMEKISEEKLSGTKDAIITDFKIYVNERDFKDIVHENDVVKVLLNVYCNQPVKEPIFGYLVKDKYGNAIFGENTAFEKLPQLDALNNYYVTFSFKWPTIAKSDYFLTVGMGNGNDEAVHEIVCWAHSIAHFQNINKGFVHAMFNNALQEIGVERRN